MIHLTRETIIINNSESKKKSKNVSLVYHSFEELEIHRAEILKKLNKKNVNVDFKYTEK